MTKFAIGFKIIANDPSEVKLQLEKLKDIKLIKIDKNKRYADLEVVVESNDLDDAISKAETKINDLLDFHSLFFTEDMEINGFFRFPNVVIDIDKNERISIPPIKVPAIMINDNPKLNDALCEYIPLINEKKNAYLRTALRFFRTARITNNIPTNIIELFAVLEALFSKDEERTEMRYRISNRIATLMGTNAAERKIILDKMRRLYDLRSTLVHGSIAKKLDHEDLFLITRNALLRFLELAKIYADHNSIVDKIDESILEDTVRTKLQSESIKLLIINLKVDDIQNARLFP